VRGIPGVVPRFLREARAATQLRGSHVVRVFDVGTTADGAPYMVMELLAGCDLGELVAGHGPLAPGEAVEFVLQACEALAEVHGSNIVHRDLKPANLFLTTAPDGRPCVKLIDFGVSRVEEPLTETELASITHPEAIMGSPRYMAPEQMEAASKADARSDIWGIGAVLYELLAGDAPYDAPTYWEIYARAKKSPPPPPSAKSPLITPALDAVVLRCLRADPDERYVDVAELAAALAPFADDGETRAEAIARVLAATRQRTGGEKFETLAPIARSRARRRLLPDVDPKRGRGLTTALLVIAVGAALVTVALRSWVPAWHTSATTTQHLVAPPPPPPHDPRLDVPPPEPPSAEPTSPPARPTEPAAIPSATAIPHIAPTPHATAIPHATPIPRATATATATATPPTPTAIAPNPSATATATPLPSASAVPESPFEDRQ
jgi:serine/threonine-protein kinase